MIYKKMKYLKFFENFVYESSSIQESVCCIVVNQKNQVLVLQRGSTAPWEPNKWNFPGGQMEPGESLEEAAKREVKEETDLDLANIKQFKKIHDKEWNYNLVVFIGKSDKTNVDLTKHPTIEDGKVIIECQDYEWVDENTYNSLEYVPYTKELIEEYLYIK
jgi:mutator protein MutT